MRTQKNDTLAGSQSFRHVLDALEIAQVLQAAIGRPATFPHFNNRHAEREKVLVSELVAFGCAELGKAEFDVASNDSAALSANRVRDSAEASAESESSRMWQQANKTQETEPYPGGPVFGRPVAM